MGSLELKKALKDAGVPLRYVKTTLPKEGYKDLRETLDSQALVTEDGIRGVSFSSATAKAFVKARLVFFTFAKEAVISGYDVAVRDMFQVIELSDTPIISAKQIRTHCDLFFIPDFAERGSPAPFDGERALKVRTFLRKLIDYGVGICTLSDHPEAPVSWYPDALVEMIRDNTVPYVINQE